MRACVPLFDSFTLSSFLKLSLLLLLFFLYDRTQEPPSFLPETWREKSPRRLPAAPIPTPTLPSLVLVFLRFVSSSAMFPSGVTWRSQPWSLVQCLFFGKLWNRTVEFDSRDHSKCSVFTQCRCPWCPPPNSASGCVDHCPSPLCLLVMDCSYCG